MVNVGLVSWIIDPINLSRGLGQALSHNLDVDRRVILTCQEI